MAATRSAYIAFPGASYTHSLALSAARQTLSGWDIVDGLASSSSSAVAPAGHALYFADYDVLPFETLLGSRTQQCSSYVIRKALIRKHHLAHALHAHALKLASRREAGGSASTTALDPQTLTPQTWIVEVQFADELDELLVDELYDLKERLDASEGRQWFILKPGMADRGNGIRLFNSEDALRRILEEMEEASDDEEEEEEEEEGDKGMLGQLRHFVIQEYLSTPLLLSPPSTASVASPRKFHLRAYVLCIGGLRVFLYDEMLALFAPLPYTTPSADDDEPDPRVHLSNTCLHADGSSDPSGRPAEENVFLLSSLVGCPLSSPSSSSSSSASPSVFTASQHASILSNVAQTIGAAFEAAARAGSVHWQTWPNAFEVFGCDLMLGWEQQGEQEPRLRSWLLEVNAQPDYAQSGSRLEQVIEKLFRRSLELAVLEPRAASASGGGAEPPARAAAAWPIGESRDGMRLCLDEELSKAW